MNAAAPAPPAGAADANSIGRALAVLGDRWTLLILRNAFMLRTRRFDVWRRQLGISESVLAARLRDLVRDGVLVRAPATGGARNEYRLTGQGLELWSLLVAIWAWEKHWAVGAAEVQPDLRHLGCGSSVTPRLVCGGCGQPVGVRELETGVAPVESFRFGAAPRFRRRSTRGSEPTAAELLMPDTIAVIGDRWSTLVLGAAMLGRRRFTEFERDLGISPTLLSDRLSRFVALGVLARGASADDPRGAYRLTDKGRAVFPIFALLIAWGDRWFPAPGGPPLAIVHRACGRPLQPRLDCDACGAVLERRHVRFVPRGRALEPHFPTPVEP